MNAMTGFEVAFEIDNQVRSNERQLGARAPFKTIKRWTRAYWTAVVAKPSAEDRAFFIEI